MTIHPSAAGRRLYEIRVAGVLDETWASWFEGLGLRDDGTGTTISGPVADQAALHGLLVKVRDLGLELISVRQLDGDARGDE